MITMQIMESEAIETLNRLANINIPEKLTKPISERLKKETQERYWNVWRQVSDTPYNVYTALKKVAFGRLKRGQLTGSTFNAIDNFYGDNFAGVGFNAFSWPANSGRVHASVEAVLNELDNIGYFDSSDDFKSPWGGHVGSSTHPFKFKYKRHSGQVSISWTTLGLTIKWPRSVQYIFQDKFFPAEPFEVKKYNKGLWTVNKFFGLNEQTTKWVFNVIDAYITVEYLKPEKERIYLDAAEPMGITMAGKVRQKTKEEISDEVARTEITGATRTRGIPFTKKSDSSSIDRLDKLFEEASKKTTKDVMDWVKTLTKQEAEQILKDIIKGIYR